MEKIKIEIPKVPTFNISIPQYGTGASITVDSEMSDTSKNPVQNKVVKKYVDNGLLPKIEFWETGKEYKAGSVVLYADKYREIVYCKIYKCLKNHTSTVIGVTNDEYWVIYGVIDALNSDSARTDYNGEVIHETYVKKKELGDIEACLDGIIEMQQTIIDIQNSYIGGETE